MKKMKLIILSMVISLLGFSLAFAATTANLSATAQVPDNSPQIALVVMELTTPDQEPWTGTNVTASGAMSFGPLTHTLISGGSAGLWYSSKYYCVFIFTTGFGKRYQVTSTSTGLISGANSLPAGSFGLTPQYIDQDEWRWTGGSLAQGPKPAAATLGDAGSAVATNKVIYTSEPSPSSDRIIRAFYSLPPFKANSSAPFPGFTPIPLSQPNGTYTGVVTITIASF